MAPSLEDVSVINGPSVLASVGGAPPRCAELTARSSRRAPEAATTPATGAQLCKGPRATTNLTRVCRATRGDAIAPLSRPPGSALACGGPTAAASVRRAQGRSRLTSDAQATRLGAGTDRHT
eukprot:scaffold4482_cov393-Prasinococcus_capsulatus_cf.AAC.12